MENSELEKRKEKAIQFLKKYQNYLQYIILAVIIWLSCKIRTANLPLLKDITTGGYIPADPDAMAFMRYASYILEHGKLMAIDTLRYYPIGYTGLQEFSLLSHLIVYLYKFLHFFNPAVTLGYADVIYPPIALSIGLIFFFLFVRKLLNYKVALISSAFLIVIPAFLFRTMAGISDKEALGIVFMFMAFYFFIYAWKSEKLTSSLITVFLAGISTALMGLVWAGVLFTFLIIGTFALTTILLNKFDNKKFYIYSTWVLSSFILLIIFFPSKYGPMNIITSITTSITVFTLLLSLIYYLIFEKRLIKIKVNLPPIITSFIIALTVGIIFLTVKQGPSFLINFISDVLNHLIRPFATNRWVITVAESHQPYVRDWFGEFSRNYLWAVIIGSVVLFYEIIKQISKKQAWKLTGVYILFILGFIFNRYSQTSVFNGENSISLTVYIGSLIFFISVLIYLYLNTYYKNKPLFEEISKTDESLIFILILFLIMVVAARSAIRLLFIFAPVTTIIFAYLVYKLYELVSKIKEKLYKIIAIVIIIIIAFSFFWGFYKTTAGQSKYIGPNYNQQWQYAGEWIRENTPENAVFAHWWDYGYLVQTGAKRATLSDGGNGRGAINHFIGRHVLTGQNNTEALELLKANNATYLLIISDEIGKYPAFSSIGSNEDYDRYSWINTFMLDQQYTKETRNGISYVYTGGTPLDEDLIYQGKLYPRRAAAMGAFMVEAQNIEENGTITGIKFLQAKGILIYNGQQLEIPINCIFFNNQETTFNDPNGIDACLRIIPTINDNQLNPINALLYLSPKVKRTLMTRLYLFNQEDEYFKLVYNDENSMPLSLYNGRLIGPLKIWEISYPDNLIIPKEYYGQEVPNPEVEKIKLEYY